MKNLKPNPLLSQWASDTDNRIDVDELTRQNGILYKGPIVSNQLNGMAYDIYSSVIYNQFTGGMYNNALTYNEGQFCTIYWQKDAYKQKKFLKCVCINKSPDGITATPPIKGASVKSTNGVEFYSGGELDTGNWRFCEEGPIQTFDVNVPFNSATTDEYSRWRLIQLPNKIEVDSQNIQTAPFTKVVEVDAMCYVEKTNIDTVNTAYFSFPLKIKATYILDMSSSSAGGKLVYIITSTLQYYSAPIEIEYGNICQFTAGAQFHPVRQDMLSIDSNYLYYGMPYGLCFSVGQDPDSTTPTDLRITVENRGLNNLRIVGTSNIQLNPVNLNMKHEDYNVNDWPFVVRPFGGSRVLPTVGQSKSYVVSDYYIDVPNLGIFGQLSLYSVTNLLNIGFIDMSKTSFWFLLINKIFKLDSTTNLIQNSVLRNFTKSFFPRISNSELGAHSVGTTQEDAIRNLTGRFNSNDPGNSPIGFYDYYPKPPSGVSTGIINDEPTRDKYRVLTYLSDTPIYGKTINIDASKLVSTTDTKTGETRPNAVIFDYRLQCF